MNDAVIHNAVLETEMTATFDHQAKHWSQDAEINRLFLRTVNNYVNDLLKARGYLFLNDILDELGLPRTSQGQLVGWLQANGNGVQLWEGDLSVLGDDDAIPLKFNVDGVIYEKLDSLS